MVWDTEVRQAVAHWGPYYGLVIDPALIHAVIERESRHGLDPNYIAHKGVVPEPGGHVSYGPMQIYDLTIPLLKIGFPAADLASHPELGIWYGVKEFGRRMKVLGGDAQKAVSAWNAGIGGVGRNPDYVAAVMSFWNRYKGTIAGTATAGAPLLLIGGLVLWMMSRRRRAA